MAKFCTNCGKPLEDGKACDCQAKKESKTNLNSETAKNYGNLFLEIVKGIFTKPVDTIKKYATEKNYLFGWLAIIVNSIFSGLFLYCLIKEGGIIATSVIGLGNLGFGGFEVSFIKVLLQGTLFMLVGFVSTAAMIYLLAGPLFKAKIDFKKVISLIGICSIFTLVTTIASTVCIYLSIKFTFFIILIAGIFYLTHLYQGISEICNINKNKLAYVFVPAISVATFVVVYILPKILF